ncbi:hypothetical protein, partial [Nonomuraea fuscirosea]|uniref:hypothetical protein n=1 Tax=Nonomuraea fuscirosea TaxID=1291556 RepID=UPI001C62ED7D
MSSDRAGHPDRFEAWQATTLLGFVGVCEQGANRHYLPGVFAHDGHSAGSGASDDTHHDFDRSSHYYGKTSSNLVGCSIGECRQLVRMVTLAPPPAPLT